MKREPGEGPRYIYTCPLRTVSTDTSIPKVGERGSLSTCEETPNAGKRHFHPTHMRDQVSKSRVTAAVEGQHNQNPWMTN